MKASELIKKAISIEDIYSQIKLQNESGMKEVNYPKAVYITQEVISQLLQDGFKIYQEERYSVMSTIIEW